MILLDSNIPMYLIGAAHPHKTDAQRLLERLISDRQRLVTDAEVLQEILHRYVAINRRDAIQLAFETLLGIVDQVLPVDLAVVERAKEIILAQKQLSARDALHVAVMEQHGSDTSSHLMQDSTEYRESRAFHSRLAVAYAPSY